MLLVRDDCVTGDNQYHIFYNRLETTIFCLEQMSYCSETFSTMVNYKARVFKIQGRDITCTLDNIALQPVLVKSVVISVKWQM